MVIQTEAERRRREAGVKQSMEIRLGHVCMYVCIKDAKFHYHATGMPVFFITGGSQWYITLYCRQCAGSGKFGL